MLPTLPPTTLPSLPPTTLPSLPVHLPGRPRPPVTKLTVPPLALPRPASCGDPWGAGDFGASQTVVNGPVSVLIGVYTCPIYDTDGGYTQFNAEVHGPDTAVDAHLDYGDGTTYDLPSRWGCDPARPDPWYLNPPTHTYGTPGTYHVAVTITTAACAAVSPGAPAKPDRATVATIDVRRIAGPRPR